MPAWQSLLVFHGFESWKRDEMGIDMGGGLVAFFFSWYGEFLRE